MDAHALDQRPSFARLGSFFFRYRDLVFPIVFLVLAVSSPPRPFLGSNRADIFLDVVGLLLASAGQGLRILVIGLAYIRRGGKDRQVYASRLVQEGIFAHSRNPLYLGNMAILAGLMLVQNSSWMYAIGIPFFLIAYLAIVAAEERYLREHFGAEFEDYCRRVPRFFLRMQGISRTIASMQFDWPKVVRKEYGTSFAAVSAGILLLLRECAVAGGWHPSALAWQVLAGVWVLALAAYLVARVLKKTGALGKG